MMLARFFSNVLHLLFGSFWHGDVDLLLVTFDSKLKIFDSRLNNQASVIDAERKFMNSSIVSPSLASRCSSTRAVTYVLRGSSCLSLATSFSNVVTLLLNWKTDAKSESVDRGFVAFVVGGGVDVDCCGGGVKDGNDYGVMVENTGEESVITETASAWGISEKFKNLAAKSNE
nr:hypothetical protein [Tanacetum cinerariifolium]